MTEPAIRLDLAFPDRDARWLTALADIDACLTQAVGLILESEGYVGAEIEIAIFMQNDAQVRVLNRRFRGRDGATNVLSFPLTPPFMPVRDEMPVNLGDIFLAYETIAAEASAHCRSLRDHTIHLTIHGLLHLIGYTHDLAATRCDMEAREISCLAGMGIANPYYLAQ